MDLFHSPTQRLCKRPNQNVLFMLLRLFVKHHIQKMFRYTYLQLVSFPMTTKDYIRNFRSLFLFGSLQTQCSTFEFPLCLSIDFAWESMVNLEALGEDLHSGTTNLHVN